MLSEKKILRSFYKLFCHLHFLLTVISTYSETIDQKKKQDKNIKMLYQQLDS